jgi:hypothetical protein
VQRKGNDHPLPAPGIVARFARGSPGRPQTRPAAKAHANCQSRTHLPLSPLWGRCTFS